MSVEQSLEYFVKEYTTSHHTHVMKTHIVSNPTHWAQGTYFSKVKEN